MRFKSTPPRNRRLLIARNWIPTYNGNHIVKGYAKYFGVSRLCAVTDLKILGYEFTEDYINQLRRDEESRRIEKIKRKNKKKIEIEDYIDNDEQDYYFFYIAGYTENGFPFGITWEQAEKQGLIEASMDDNHHIEEDLPF